VGPGSRSHSSFSSARRYLARILVSASSSEMSIRARIRASRSVAPMSGMCRRNLVVGVLGHGNRLCRRRALPKGGDEALRIALADEHLAGLGARVARNHAAALEHVDQAPGARVAEPEAALEH